MAALGNIGVAFNVAYLRAGRGSFTLVKQPVSVDATGTGTPNAMVTLARADGARVGITRADGYGAWHFYDLDDGTYYASEVGSANAWEIVVSGSTATVTLLSSGASTSSFGYIG